MCHSTSRLSTLKSFVILTQTDTTVGFLSQDEAKLKKIKNRSDAKPFIKVYKNFASLTTHKRFPDRFKNQIRRAKKTTFIIKGESFRVAKEQLNSQILRDASWNYSTSANEKGKHFEKDFCVQHADIIIEDTQGLFEGKASTLLKLNHTTRKRLR
jgi:tRNA A37 threonylcarbamoyladenosine synthetase subunit TsaC/SUA5/YrdC